MAIITISRGSYAGGKAVAEQLAQALGHPLLSREEVLQQASKDYGVIESELRQALNNSPRYWEQVLGKRITYVKCLTAVLLEHAQAGNLVYHGNLGHLLVSNLPQVLRVRIVADMEYRVRAAMEAQRMTRELAMAHIQRVDSERGRWAQMLYGVDWQDATQYTAVLNVSQMSLSGAVEVLQRIAGMPEFQPTVENRQHFEDVRLAARVWAAMARNPVTRSAGIEVTANCGEVLISGSVSSAKALDMIHQIASGVDGVKSIRSEAGIGTHWFW